MPRFGSALFDTNNQQVLLYMKKTNTKSHQDEPVGIVISRGSRAEPAPIFHAFEWGPAPELTPVPQDTKAA
ncbi:MAG: hypothetical protein ACJ796_21380 [Gemmatimonadaceae bacterium]